MITRSQQGTLPRIPRLGKKPVVSRPSPRAGALRTFEYPGRAWHRLRSMDRVPRVQQVRPLPWREPSRALSYTVA